MDQIINPVLNPPVWPIPFCHLLTDTRFCAVESLMTETHLMFMSLRKLSKIEGENSICKNLRYNVRNKTV